MHYNFLIQYTNHLVCKPSKYNQTAAELNEELFYELRMFGIPSSSPTITYCNNENDVKSKKLATSSLEKKQNSANHKLRECVAQNLMETHFAHSK